MFLAVPEHEILKGGNGSSKFFMSATSGDLLTKKVCDSQVHDGLFFVTSFHLSERRERHGTSTCEASIKVVVNGKHYHKVADGCGPVNALDLALRKTLEDEFPKLTKVRLTDYLVNIVGKSFGSSARTHVVMFFTDADGIDKWEAEGTHESITEASLLALTSGFVKFLSK